MSSIKLEVWTEASPERVYKLLSSAESIGTWWDKQTVRETPEGIVLEHSPGADHGTVSFLILKSEPVRLVKWRCISTHPGNVPASEWTNTEITFKIGSRASSEVATDEWASGIPVQTVIRFDHSGWPSDSKYFAFCSYAWGNVLGKLTGKAVENDS